MASITDPSRVPAVASERGDGRGWRGAAAEWIGRHRVAAATLVLLTGITALLMSSVPMAFHVRWPSARVPLETAGAVVAGLAAALAYLWYSFTGSPSTLLIAIAFAVRSVNQLAFVVFLSHHSGATGGLRFVWFWAVSRLAVAGLLLAAALLRGRPAVRTRHPLLLFLGSSAAAVAAVSAGQALLWSLGSSLPALGAAELAPGAFGVLPGLTSVAVLLGVVGFAAYLSAAFLFLSPARTPDGGRPPARAYGDGDWLAIALIVAGFSHLHYMLFPAMVPGEVTTGDFLRLAFVVVLMVGLLWEVRTLLLRERRRSEEMAQFSRERSEVQRLLSHDLMHSMSVLRTYAAHLTRMWDKLDDGDRLFSAERIDRQSARVRDLLDESVAAMDANGDPVPLVVRPVLATVLMEDGLDSVDNRSGRVRVSIAPGCGDAIVRADRIQLTQVLRNLLHNAQTYSDPGAPIDLRLAASPTEVRIEVEDRGPGIPARDLPKLFHRFERLGNGNGHHGNGNGNGGHTNGNGHNGNGNGAADHVDGDGSDHGEADENGGWGVGLYLSRNVVLAHGGDITVASEAGRGSTFVVTLPRWAADE